MVVDLLVATVVTILQLLQHLVSLKSGAFVAQCRIVTVSRPRYSLYPASARRLPISVEDDEPSPSNHDVADDHGKNWTVLSLLNARSQRTKLC